MLEVIPNFPPGVRPRVLLMGAHSDDIEIGCGGTVLKLLQTYPDAELRWIVFSAEEEERRREALESARELLAGAREPTIVVKGFRTSFFPYSGADIKAFFEEIKAAFEPDLIFTHYRNDLHQDHRVLCELTWNTFRNHLVLEYEIPKYDGDLGIPNAFVSLDDALVERKVDHLMRAFGSQRSKHWFTPDTFLGLMRIRGLESGTRHAEAFHVRKLRLLGWP